MHTETVKIRQFGIRKIHVSREFAVEAPHHIHSDPLPLKAWIDSLEKDGDPLEYWTPHGGADVEVIRSTVIEEDPLVRSQQGFVSSDEY